MLTEIVMVKLPDGMTRDEVISNFEATATTWRENPDLIRKNYVFDAASGVAGGVYLWNKRAHAEKWHGAQFRKTAREIYGAEPDIQLFETPIVVDNVVGEIVRD